MTDFCLITTTVIRLTEYSELSEVTFPYDTMTSYQIQAFAILLIAHYDRLGNLISQYCVLEFIGTIAFLVT